MVVAWDLHYGPSRRNVRAVCTSEWSRSNRVTDALRTVVRWSRNRRRVTDALRTVVRAGPLREVLASSHVVVRGGI